MARYDSRGAVLMRRRNLRASGRLRRLRAAILSRAFQPEQQRDERRDGGGGWAAASCGKLQSHGSADQSAD